MVVALCVTTLLLWVGGSAILPLLPAYLRAHGSTPGLVGLVMASYFAASVLTQYPAGRLSDRIGRRSIVVAGLTVFAIGSVGFALAAGPGFAILFRSLQGIGAGAVTVAAAATVGSTVAAQDRGGAFGALYGSQMLALAVGPLLGSLVGAASMKLLFLVGACSAVVAVVPLARLTRADRHVVHREGRLEGENRVRELEALSGAAPDGLPLTAARRSFALTPAVTGVLIAFFATGLLVGVYESCWTLLLRLRGADRFEIGLSWTLFALPFAVLSLPAGRLADHLDRRLLAIGGLGASAVFAALYPFLHSVRMLVGFGSLEAACAVIGAPAAVLILTESTSSDAQGEAQGALETGRTAATAASAAASGALFAVDPAVPFTLAAALSVLACAAMAWTWRKTPSRPVRRLAVPSRSPGAPEGQVAGTAAGARRS